MFASTVMRNLKLERLISLKISGIIERAFDGKKIKTKVLEDIVQLNIPDSDGLFKNLSFTFRVTKDDDTGKFKYRLMSTDGFIESDENLIKFLENFSKV